MLLTRCQALQKPFTSCLILTTALWNRYIIPTFQMRKLRPRKVTYDLPMVMGFLGNGVGLRPCSGTARCPMLVIPLPRALVFPSRKLQSWPLTSSGSLHTDFPQL